MTVHYHIDGLGIGAIRYRAAVVAEDLYNNIIGKASGVGERQFATVLKTYRASRSLSCVKNYSCITVLRTYRHWRGHCGAGAGGDVSWSTCRASQCVVRNLT